MLERPFLDCKFELISRDVVQENSGSTNNHPKERKEREGEKQARYLQTLEALVQLIYVRRTEQKALNTFIL